MSDTPQHSGSGRVQPPMRVDRIHLPDHLATLSALRVVLGLPRVIPSPGADNLLSDAG